MSEALSADLFFSFRSPYSYLAIGRYRALAESHDVDITLRPVWPLAVREPDFFEKNHPNWLRYTMLDMIRVAQFHGIPFGAPRPDPIIQDVQTRKIAQEQPYIRRITRLGQAAARRGKGVAFAHEAGQLIWGGAENWHEGEHLAGAASRAGLDLAELDAEVAAEPDALDAEIATNQQSLEDAGHWGVPTLVFDGEPFFGQDRIDMAKWRMEQKGLESIKHQRELRSEAPAIGAKQWLDDQYRLQGHRLGYSFIYCPQSQLETADVLTVGLNPGGNHAGDLLWDNPAGNAYLVDDWTEGKTGGTTIQQQVRKLFAALGDPEGERAASLQFIPFRSPDWASRNEKDAATEVGLELWKWVRQRSSPKLIVTIGKGVAAQSIVGLEGGVYEASFDLGWGKVSADRYVLGDGTILVAMPHLSRYAVFGRAESEAGLRKVFAGFWRD